MGEFVKAAKKNEIEPGTGKMVEIGDKSIAIFNCDGEFYAIDDTCPHQGGPLSEGEVDGKEVTCPWHAAVFDLSSGEMLDGPADDVQSYNVRLSGDDIEIEV